jgi:hypothetical protein
VTFLAAVPPNLASPPRSLRGLVSGSFPLAVTRSDERTLAVHLGGGLFDGILGRLFRGPDRPLALGQVVALPGLSATVAALSPPDGQPSDVVFRFSVPLEDPSLRWLQWQGKGYAPFVPPAIGRTVTLAAPRNAFALPGSKD